MLDSADISPCGAYRYDLRRHVNFLGNGNCLFLMLNPSTADGLEDDPTIRRCRAYVCQWGYKNLIVANLFSYRATDPRQLFKAQDPIGPEGNPAIMDAVSQASVVVCAWGTHGGYLDRDQAVNEMLQDAGCDLKCLGTTKDGYPVHPLYQPKDAKLIPYGGRHE